MVSEPLAISDMAKNVFVFAGSAGYGVYNYENKFFRYEGQWESGLKHGKMQSKHTHTQS